jgi:hypothetical protein
LGIAVSRWKTSILAQIQKASLAPFGHLQLGRFVIAENSNGPYLLGIIAHLTPSRRPEVAAEPTGTPVAYQLMVWASTRESKGVVRAIGIRFRLFSYD